MNKKSPLILIVIPILAIVFIVLFYLYVTVGSMLKIANRNLIIDSSVKKDVSLSKKDIEDYSLDEKTLNSKLFNGLKNYQNKDNVQIGREDIFYKNDK